MIFTFFDVDIFYPKRGQKEAFFDHLILSQTPKPKIKKTEKTEKHLSPTLCKKLNLKSKHIHDQSKTDRKQQQTICGF